MSTFACPVVRVRAVEPIPGADLIELAVVGEFRSVVRKGSFKAGDLAVYIPEAAIVPDWLLERMGLTGKLAGAKTNRVKAISLRGCLSQGLLLATEPVADGSRYVPGENDATGWIVREDDDVAELLGVEKYVPPIPAGMDGQVFPLFGHVPRIRSPASRTTAPPSCCSARPSDRKSRISSTACRDERFGCST
jgi:RNA ligase (TIGR02306 family)